MPRGTILVVDDSPLTLEAMRRGLEASGFVVRCASDLADVPRPLRAGDADLVLMDVEMAEAFGDDLAMVLRADGDPGGPAIYLLSALDEDELAERADSAGVDGFIHKRAGVDEVVRRVEAILGAPDAPPARDVRDELVPMFVETARRRVRTARAVLSTGRLRQAGYELHALVGEAAVLGFAELAGLAHDGRQALERCAAAPSAEARRDCEERIAALEARVEAVAAAAPAASRAPAAPAARKGRRVLLLDDSDLYRATMRAILEDSGYDVTEAASCAECRTRLGVEDCDVVLCDVELGDGSGIDLIPEVRAAMPRAAIVVLSGGDVLTLPTAADLVLLKTLDPTSVLVKLERVLDERA